LDKTKGGSYQNMLGRYKETGTALGNQNFGQRAVRMCDLLMFAGFPQEGERREMWRTVRVLLEWWD
jgi:hypothetical protein